jgi:hypothetical protein
VPHVLARQPLCLRRIVPRDRFDDLAMLFDNRAPAMVVRDVQAGKAEYLLVQIVESLKQAFVS